MARVLVYTDGGLGASEACVTMAIRELRRALSWLNAKKGAAEDAVVTVERTDAASIVGGELERSCRLLVMPGGRDLPYCSLLNGRANEKIRSFVKEGGGYLGLCAGGYYGASRVEFSVGDPVMEVVGPRELNFYPGVARGPVFPGFRYDSNAGALACSVRLKKSSGTFQTVTSELSSSLSVFYNGGCYFTEGICADATAEDLVRNVDVLATYEAPPQASVEQQGTDSTQLDVPLPNGPAQFPDGLAAIVSMSYGRGRVVLSGVHIEASPPALNEVYHRDPYIETLLHPLTPGDTTRQYIFNTLIEQLIQ